MAEEVAPQPYPIYDTTFTLHRVSPLYTGAASPLDNASLQQHSGRFRDILAGDTLRGVRVSLGYKDDILEHVGALQSVKWQILPDEERWGMEDETRMDASMAIGSGKGMVVDLNYEKIKYRAIMLRGERGGVDGKEGTGFEHFPLLLTRMPASLRDAFASFLATTFDARIAPLHLGGPALSASFETYLSNCNIGEDGESLELSESSGTLRKIIKDVRVELQFQFPRGNDALQRIAITIDQEDMPRLVHRGKAFEKQDSPFMNALTNYMEAHLAMRIDHQRVNVFTIACAAFVLGAEGKLKLTAPTATDVAGIQNRATWNLANGLVETARGRDMFGKDTF